MLKVNDWYYVPYVDRHQNEKGTTMKGILMKILTIEDSQLYVSTESWDVYDNRDYRYRGIADRNDIVYITKYGKKVLPPSKMFEVLYSATVNGSVGNCQELDDENDYNDC